MASPCSSDSRGGSEDRPCQVDQGTAWLLSPQPKPVLTTYQHGATTLALRRFNATQKRLTVQSAYLQPWGVLLPPPCRRDGCLWQEASARVKLHLTVAHPSPSWDNNKCPTFGEGGWQQACLEEHIFYLPPAEAKPFPLKQ